jgi:signal transduction histidine kinase
VKTTDETAATPAADPAERWACDTTSSDDRAEAVADEVAALRAALARERDSRRRAECLAHIQSDAMQLALDLLVREPDIDGFFGTFIETLVHDCESQACGVFLVDQDQQGAHLWMAYFQNHLFKPGSPDWQQLALPRTSMADHLFAHKAGWTETTEYVGDDARLPEAVRTFNRNIGADTLAVAPLVLGAQTLGWIALATGPTSLCEGEWRVALLRALARQATLALHQNRVAVRGASEERRKAILEERNRLARDIHDTLAQGFAAILMQLQGAQREACTLPPRVASKLETAVDLARNHIIEARRSVSALRPHLAGGEDLASALRRVADRTRRTTEIPIEIVLDELPPYGDAVEREIVSIAQEALTNAVRHSAARRITLRAASARSIGVRLTVQDDGRGIAGERRSAGFGMTSMQERADRIGASLTIVTAPRAGTEVVLAWEPTVAPSDAYVAG